MAASPTPPRSGPGRRLAWVVVPILLVVAALAAFGPRDARHRAVAGVEVPIRATGAPARASVAAFEARAVAVDVAEKTGATRAALTDRYAVEVIGREDVELSYIDDEAARARRVVAAAARAGLDEVLADAADRAASDAERAGAVAEEVGAELETIARETGGVGAAALYEATEAGLGQLKQERAAAAFRGDAAAVASLDGQIAVLQEDAFNLRTLATRETDLLEQQAEAEADLSFADERSREAEAAQQPERLEAAVNVGSGGTIREAMGLPRQALALAAALAAAFVAVAALAGGRHKEPSVVAAPALTPRVDSAAPARPLTEAPVVRPSPSPQPARSASPVGRPSVPAARPSPRPSRPSISWHPSVGSPRAPVSWHTEPPVTAEADQETELEAVVDHRAADGEHAVSAETDRDAEFEAVIDLLAADAERSVTVAPRRQSEFEAVIDLLAAEAGAPRAAEDRADTRAPVADGADGTSAP